MCIVYLCSQDTKIWIAKILFQNSTIVQCTHYTLTYVLFCVYVYLHIYSLSLQFYSVCSRWGSQFWNHWMDWIVCVCMYVSIFSIHFSSFFWVSCLYAYVYIFYLGEIAIFRPWFLRLRVFNI